MNRYVLAPAAARDLFQIWRYIKKERSESVANGVERVIREKLVLLARSPGLGHRRPDLTSADVRFFPVYSYLVVYRPKTMPLQIAAILHGSRDVAKLLLNRLP